MPEISDTAPPKAGSLWRLPGIRRLTIYTVLGFLGFFLTLASLPAWMASTGTGEGIAGLVTTVFLAGTIGTQIVVPRLAIRFGLPRILVAGAVLLGAPAPLLAVSSDLWWVLAVSVVRGCGFGILTVLGSSLSALIVPAKRRGEAIGIYGLAIAIPNLIAVPLGVALAASGQFRWVAFIAAAPLLAIPAAFALGRSVPSPSATQEHPGPDGATPAVAAADSGYGTGSGRAAALATVPPAIVLLVVTLAGGGLLTYLPIVRPSGATAAVAVLAFGATGALTRWLVGGMADRIGTRLLLPVSSAAAIVGLVIVAVGLVDGGSDAVVIVGGAILGAGYGAVQNLTLVTAFSRAGSNHTHTASSVWNVGFDGGTALGAAVVGVAAVGMGASATFAVFAALIAITLPLAIKSTRART